MTVHKFEILLRRRMAGSTCRVPSLLTWSTPWWTRCAQAGDICHLSNSSGSQTGSFLGSLFKNGFKNSQLFRLRAFSKKLSASKNSEHMSSGIKQLRIVLSVLKILIIINFYVWIKENKGIPPNCSFIF